mmetsp:Transcript_27073/g.69675  ORF Transcript_27073/g.69675 Transcript_27073/m.69675 type:complete len:468 (-) Transcript_27073:391-1794(-)
MAGENEEVELELKGLLRDLNNLSKRVQEFTAAAETELEKAKTDKGFEPQEALKVKHLIAQETENDSALVRRITHELGTLLARRRQLEAHLQVYQRAKKRASDAPAGTQVVKKPAGEAGVAKKAVVQPQSQPQPHPQPHPLMQLQAQGQPPAKGQTPILSGDRAPLQLHGAPTTVAQTSVFMSLTTCNRFWHAALTLLTFINTALPKGTRRVVYVIDDASDDKFAASKRELLHDLKRRGLIQKLEMSPRRMGFIKVRERVVDSFFESGCSHWFHTDDDILLSPDCVWRPIMEMETFVGPSLNFVFVNSWCKPKPLPVGGSPMTTLEYAGGASFVVSRSALEKIGNIYKGLQVENEETNRIFWTTLHRNGIPTVTNLVQPYRCQHVGNIESVIYGETPNWENLFAVNHRTGEYLPVDGFDFAKLRQSIRTHQLHLLLQEKNKNEEKIFHNTLNADIIKKAAGLVESPQK